MMASGHRFYAVGPRFEFKKPDFKAQMPQECLLKLLITVGRGPTPAQSKSFTYWNGCAVLVPLISAEIDMHNPGGFNSRHKGFLSFPRGLLGLSGRCLTYFTP